MTGGGRRFGIVGIDRDDQAHAHVPRTERLAVGHIAELDEVTETGSTSQVPSWISAPMLSGSTRGMFSKNPPPVMWASAFGSTPVLGARQPRRGSSCAA